jgi:hypothetical protein
MIDAQGARPQTGRDRRSWLAMQRRAGQLALGLGAVVVGLWLLDILWLTGGEAGRRLPEALARTAIAAALAAGAAWLVLGGAAHLTGRRGRALAAALLLPGLVALSLAVRFAGIDSEVGGRYYLDEGTYYHHATAIDAGEVLRPTFVYPHFLYYADALTLWVAARFPAAVAAAARRLYGLDEPLAVAWLLLRSVVALLSALTVVPVYRIAERLAGPSALGGRTAGALAAALLIFSNLYNEGSHLNTCDVPSAFFATLCLLAVVRLMDRESTAGYVLAGAAAGLAGASKYPAALVALAIAAVWAGWRMRPAGSAGGPPGRRRDWNAGLLWAALAAAATAVAVMPSLLAFPGLAFTGQRGIFFGARQYGGGGWLGVLPDSNAAFYTAKALGSFGWPAAAAGLSGLVVLAVRAVRERRSGAAGNGRAAGRLGRLLWLAPYPVAFLVLISAMNMVVKRNLYPVLPILAVYLGVGMAAWVELAAERAAARRLAVAGAGEGAAGGRWSAAGSARRPGWLGWLGWLGLPAVLLAACLWVPAEQVGEQTVGYLTPGTREEALAWMRQHLPAGASIVKESYTPDFPPGRFAVSHQRFAARTPIEELRSTGNDYLLLSSAAYSRFRDPAALFTENQREIARRYEVIFSTFPLVREWDPGDYQLGPVLRLYRIDPAPAACGPAAELPAGAAFVPDETMRASSGGAGSGGPVRYSAPGQWSLFRACLPAGRYRLALRGPVGAPARVRVTDVAGAEMGWIELHAFLRPPAADGGAAPAASSPGTAVQTGGPPAALGGELSLARGGKVLLYVYLNAGSRLRSLALQRQ